MAIKVFYFVVAVKQITLQRAEGDHLKIQVLPRKSLKATYCFSTIEIPTVLHNICYVCWQTNLLPFLFITHRYQISNNK